MSDDDRELRAFAKDLQQEVLAAAEQEGDEGLLPHVFTRYMIEQVIAAGELTDGHQVFFRRKGLEASGYAVDDDETTLDLFVTVYTGAGEPATLKRDNVEKALKRVRKFFDKASTDLAESIEEASPAHDLALRVREVAGRIDTLRLFFFTDGVTTLDYVAPEESGGLRTLVSLWDLRRLQRFVTSGLEQEPIAIDFVKQFGAPIPCLDAGTEDEGAYRAILAVFPASILEGIYAQYGSRLLELNVRSFLSARGKVNRGIRDTIIAEPGRFLAYNNGISATASAVDLVRDADGGTAIGSVRDLQIVNGAQTTASLHHAVRREKADLSAVSVQAKITVVRPEQLDELVPLVSRYSNSQNKVSEADFSANDPFHVRVETLSRTTWAPATDGTQRQTRWFYERARGQYQDAVSRAGTPARQKNFRLQHPPSQKFTKTDLAKFENTWHGLPHIVSRGAQKNFVEFTLRPKQRRLGEDAANYFELLVARAIVFRQAERLIKDLGFSAYRANIVTYTIAVIVQRRGPEIDLPTIWRTQSIPQPLSDAIEVVASDVNAVLTDPPSSGNVTEWAKKEECWDVVKQRVTVARVPRIAKNSRGPAAEDLRAEQDVAREQEKVRRVMAAIPAAGWDQLILWSRQSGHLTIRDREVAMVMSNGASRGKPPSLSYAEKARTVLQEAQRLGFKLETNGDQPTHE